MLFWSILKFSSNSIASISFLSFKLYKTYFFIDFRYFIFDWKSNFNFEKVLWLTRASFISERKSNLFEIMSYIAHFWNVLFVLLSFIEYKIRILDCSSFKKDLIIFPWKFKFTSGFIKFNNLIILFSKSTANFFTIISLFSPFEKKHVIEFEINWQVKSVCFEFLIFSLPSNIGISFFFKRKFLLKFLLHV